MADQKRFDIIIAGAGAAGLSLLWRIMDSPVLRDLKILLVDQSFEPKNDKTWCFWEDFDLPDPDLIHHAWKNLLVRVNGKTYSENLKRYQYQCLRSIDFERAVFKRAKANPNITLFRTDILDFSGKSGVGTVQTTEGNFSAKYIFQSVKKPSNFEHLKVDNELTQHFLGWEIETEYERFNPKTATFMDFEVSQKQGVTFMYILPFSKTKALVEYTIFSKKILERDIYRSEIEAYLKENYQLNHIQYSVHREEFGAIPMEDRKYPAWYCDGVLNIGTVAGLAKPSTGYTFSRIQKHSQKIITALESGNTLPKTPASSYRFRVYDLMMLYILNHENQKSLTVFDHLFHKNSFDRVMEFLAEETSFPQELKIFSGMPYLPFFRSIYQMKHRIFTGA